MPIKVEAAVVTQKRQNAAFNSDSVNINGKVLPRETILNGYKGAGVMSDSVFFALITSEIEGFADAAVAAFNDRAESFKAENANPSEIITSYFKDSVFALGQMGHKSSELISSIMYAAGRTVILAKTGNTQLYSFTQDVLIKSSPVAFLNEDGSSEYGLAKYSDVSVDDIFLLLSPGVLQVISEKDIEDICRVSEGSVKKIVNLITKVASVKEGDSALSVIAVKVLETDLTNTEEAEGFVADFSAYDNDTPEREDNVIAPVVPDLTDEYEKKEYNTNKKNKALIGGIAVGALVVILGIVALASRFLGGGATTEADPSTTGALETTTAKGTVITIDLESTTSAVTTTKAPVTTTAAAVSENEQEEEEEDEPAYVPSSSTPSSTQAPETEPSTSYVPPTTAEPDEPDYPDEPDEPDEPDYPDEPDEPEDPTEVEEFF